MSFGVALLVGEWGIVGWGRKSYLGPAEISSFSRFYFYEPSLFQIFFPWKFINIKSFPCLVSLLQPTAKQITISINIFICFCCFKYYTVMVYRKNWKWSIWYISNGLQKKLFIEKNRFFSVGYVKINVVHTWLHMQCE